MSNLFHSALTAYTRSFPLQKGKQRVLSLLWKPLSFGQYRRKVELRQARVKMLCDVRNLIQRQIYFFGAYETEICEYWIKQAPAARTIFDLGANVGLYSLLASATNPRAVIHSFEPTPQIFEILSKNIELNQFKNIRLNQLCVGDEDGIAFLNFCHGDDQSNEGMNFITAHAAQNTVEVQQVTLDKYCQQHGIPQIDLMKMDIEGGEYKALLGAQQLLADKAIKCIFMEMVEWSAKRAGNSIGDIKTLFSKYDYHFYRIQDQQLILAESGKLPDDANFIVLAEPPKP